ncbi:MAG TPA: AAA-like domain-containing protein, partial [Bryobacteraceae bacterium]|nr:AAA-like domain-containing protein [Bryobacteraceae bacterium]
MNSKPGRANFYVAGGAVPRDAPCYVMRDADLDLHAALVRGEFCYVLTPRQTGKSSLMTRMIARLREEGAQALQVDLESLGVNLSVEQWYFEILDRVGLQLELRDQLEAYWYAHSSLGPLQRWIDTIREVVLARTQSPVFLFFDSIEAAGRLSFPTDEFFAAIRGVYAERAHSPALNRLNFCLLGAANATELVGDAGSSPFPGGHRVELTDFTEQEAQVLLPGLGRAGSHALPLLKRILYWTGGHPYLTQRLCQAVVEDQRVRRPGGVDRVCAAVFFAAKSQETDENLLSIRERMLRGGPNPVDLLTAYLNIWTGRMEKDDPSDALLNELRLAGVVRSEGGYLRVRNPIYQRVFDQKFVESHQPQDEAARQHMAERRGRMQVLVFASGLVAAFGALAISAWISRQTALEKNAEYASVAEAGMNAFSNAADAVYQISAKHPELSASYAAIVKASDAFVDGMLKADPNNSAANNLKANRLDAGIQAAIQANDAAAARKRIQECLDRAEDLKDSADIRLRSVAARLFATAGEGFGKLGETHLAESNVEQAEELAREISSKVKRDDDFTRKNLSIVYSLSGGAEAALDHWDRAVQKYKRNPNVDPAADPMAKLGEGGRDFQAVRAALEARNQTARAEVQNRNYEAARKILEEHSLSIAHTLVKWSQDPSLKRTAADKLQAIADLRDVEMQLGDVLAAKRSTWPDALKYYQAALEEGQKLAGDAADPANTVKQEDAALAVARMRKLMGQTEAALGAYNKYIAILRRRDTVHPTKDTVEKLGFAYQELATFEARHGTKSAAPADYESAIEWLSKIAGADPAAQRKLAATEIRLADVESGFGQSEQARENYTKAARTSERCVAYDLQHRAAQEEDREAALLVDYENLAFGKLGLGDRKGALDAIAKLLDHAK